jgi:hypothetical protein
MHACIWSREKVRRKLPRISYDLLSNRTPEPSTRNPEGLDAKTFLADSLSTPCSSKARGGSGRTQRRAMASPRSRIVRRSSKAIRRVRVMRARLRPWVRAKARAGWRCSSRARRRSCRARLSVPRLRSRLQRHRFLARLYFYVFLS